MKKINEMTKEELAKLSSDEIKKRVKQEIQDILSKDKAFVGAKVSVEFKSKKVL